jgi:hypothetical protein
MTCPNPACGHDRPKVRETKRGASDWRELHCPACGLTWESVERVSLIHVTASADGRRPGAPVRHVTPEEYAEIVRRQAAAWRPAP